MKPRIFVSSTFYDLKYVREDLAGFIRAHDFEPIMFEEGDIGYEPGKALDDSCYEAMRNSDMAILIIGGQYGSDATKQDTDKTDEFISITQKEFKSAVDSGIPVFAFIDTKVHAEYEVYKNNFEIINKSDNDFKFNNTKDIRVFKFIRNVYTMGNIPVNEFIKISDIKKFLSKQWSDMFKKHLSQLKENKEIESIKSSVSQLESLVNKMSVMLDAIGKNVLNKESNEYANIKNQQKAIEICEKIKSMCQIAFELNGETLTTEKRSCNIIEMLFNWNDIIISIKKNECNKGNAPIDWLNKKRFGDIWEIAKSYEMRVGINVKVLVDNINDVCEDLKNDTVRKMVQEELIKIYDI